MSLKKVLVMENPRHLEIVEYRPFKVVRNEDLGDD